MMRKESFVTRVTVAALVSWLVCTTTVSAGAVKVMSYNVLASWDQARGDRIAAVIRSQAPDILGLQEVVGENIDYLYEQLSEEFSIYFTGTLDPVLIRKGDGLRLVDSGTTDIFRCLVDRQVNWIRLQESESGREFIYYNTHLCFILQDNLGDVTNEEANQIQAGEIIDVMVGHAEDDLVQIVGGDLNTFSSSNTTRFFIEGRPLPYNGKENPLTLKDTWSAAPDNSGEKPSTRNGRLARQGQARGGGMGARFAMPDEPGIDWLFVSRSATVVAAEVVRDELTQNTSDHLPITATIML